MKKVLRILNRFNVGGPTHNATYLTKYLSPDFETRLIAGKKLISEASSEYILDDNEIDYVIVNNMNRSLNLYKDLLAYIEIRNIMKSYKPDIVHTHASKSGALGRLAAVSLKVPIIIHTFHGHVFHSYFGRLKTYFYILIERFLAKKSNAIIAISNLQKKELSEDFKICNPDKISVIPLGFELDKFQENTDENRANFRNEFSINKNEILIGIVGRLTKIKNHKFFLDSIKSVVNQIKQPIKVFIIGDGEEKEILFDYSKELGFSISSTEKKDNNALIHFVSWRSDMCSVYAGLDIVALTSLNEGTPVTLIEAQAAKKPVISTDVGGVRDVVRHGVTGLLSKRGDSKNFVKNLILLIEDSNLRELMGSSGNANVSKTFSYKRLIKDVSYLYNHVLDE